MNYHMPILKWLPWIGIEFAASVAGYFLNMPSIPINPIALGLVISSSSLDIGTIWEGSSFVHKLLVENRSSNEIQVAEVLTSCFCVAASPTRFRVPANGTVELELKLDPRRGRSASSIDRRVSKSIREWRTPN